MTHSIRKIGLSLGADICWPLCFEELVKRLDLKLELGSEQLTFEVERVTIEPYSLAAPAKYDLVIDRITHWYKPTREWVKQIVAANDVYVFNNPWAIQAMEKHTTYAAMMRLGLPVPETWLLPAKDYEPHPDLQVTLQRYGRLFDLGEVGDAIGYPMFMKPYDGGGWAGVSRIADAAALREAYEKSGKLVMHLQRAVSPFDLFVRCIGLGPQLRTVRYDADQPLHDRYTMDRDFMSDADVKLLEDMTLTINGFFNWDFNSCEALRKDGVFHPIDFANACPDSQVTSLHYHFPWLVKAYVKWAIFCAATRRKVRPNLDWEPYFAVAKLDLPFRDKLARYAAITRQRLDADSFGEFCAKHLSHLDEVARDFFITDAAKTAVRKKVEALFPRHEVESFTELFWTRIQKWRQAESR